MIAVYVIDNTTRRIALVHPNATQKQAAKITKEWTDRDSVLLLVPTEWLVSNRVNSLVSSLFGDGSRLVIPNR